MTNLKQNSVIWDGKKRGFYEAYYIQCNDPISGMAWWFRYSILIPKEGHGQPYAALWAVQYDATGARGPLAMKHVVPINHFRFEKDRFIIYIDEAFMTNSHATGLIRHGDRSLKWDIQWTPADAEFRHLPGLLYSLPFPSSKVVSPHWATTGGGFIRWNEGEFYISDALIHVGHVWGNALSKNWAWAHCHGFQESPTAVFEGLWIPFGGSFGLSKCWFSIDGNMTSFNNCGSVWQQSNFLKNNRWELDLENSEYAIKGAISVDPGLVAGVTYHDPLGNRRFCYNSKVSVIDIDVFDKKKKDRFKLHAPQTAAFEICTPQELGKFPVLV